jgi:hypothetical protein
MGVDGWPAYLGLEANIVSCAAPKSRGSFWTWFKFRNQYPGPECRWWDGGKRTEEEEPGGRRRNQGGYGGGWDEGWSCSAYSKHTHTQKTCVTGRTQATCGAVHNQLGMLLWRREGGRFMAAHSSPLASRRAQRKVCSWGPLVEIRPAIWVHNENSSQAHSLLPTRETESIIHLFFLKKHFPLSHN